ncbi:MAG: hypothetical protein Q7U08_02720 [Flavobacteriaceae bacterium]|nr:hypothetical protein [Flavobacteriaceae bacterium]
MKILKLAWAIIFMIGIYFFIAIAVKNYVDWIYSKKVIWIIIITLFVISIPRIILNIIPFMMGDISGNTDTLMKIASVISWVARTLYFIFIILIINIYSTPSIIISVSCYLLFIGLSNFFAHGIIYHISIQKNDN